MAIHDEPEGADIFGDLINDCSDTPASCKFAGLAGHSHDLQPCAWCKITLGEIPTAKAYDRESESSLTSIYGMRLTPTTLEFVLKDDYELLKAGFQARNAGKARRDVILKTSGARFSIVNVIPGWLPSTKSALDFMHCIFLGALFAIRS
jgi:hypothetical protein